MNTQYGFSEYENCPHCNCDIHWTQLTRHTAEECQVNQSQQKKTESSRKIVGGSGVSPAMSKEQTEATEAENNSSPTSPAAGRKKRSKSLINPLNLFSAVSSAVISNGSQQKASSQQITVETVSSLPETPNSPSRSKRALSDPSTPSSSMYCMTPRRRNSEGSILGFLEESCNSSMCSSSEADSESMLQVSLVDNANLPPPPAYSDVVSERDSPQNMESSEKPSDSSASTSTTTSTSNQKKKNKCIFSSLGCSHEAISLTNMQYHQKCCPYGKLKDFIQDMKDEQQANKEALQHLHLTTCHKELQLEHHKKQNEKLKSNMLNMVQIMENLIQERDRERRWVKEAIFNQQQGVFSDEKHRETLSKEYHQMIMSHSLNGQPPSQHRRQVDDVEKKHFSKSLPIRNVSSRIRSASNPEPLASSSNRSKFSQKNLSSSLPLSAYGTTHPYFLEDDDDGGAL